MILFSILLLVFQLNLKENVRYKKLFTFKQINPNLITYITFFSHTQYKSGNTMFLMVLNNDNDNNDICTYIRSSISFKIVYIGCISLIEYTRCMDTCSYIVYTRNEIVYFFILISFEVNHIFLIQNYLVLFIFKKIYCLNILLKNVIDGSSNILGKF